MIKVEKLKKTLWMAGILSRKMFLRSFLENPQQERTKAFLGKVL